MDFVSDTFSKSLLDGLHTQRICLPIYHVSSQKSAIWKIQKN